MTKPITDSRGHGAATLYEAAVAVDANGRYALAAAIRAAWPDARLAGPAFTVQGAGGDNLALHHAVYAAPAGSVLVADCNGAQYGHWGEVLAVAAQARQLGGLVIDGAVRDVAEMGKRGFPVFSRNRSVRGTRKLFRGAQEVEIEIGGVRVCTGDLVVGDADGVVVVPAQIASIVVERADERVREEDAIFQRLQSGESTLDIYQLRSSTHE